MIDHVKQIEISLPGAQKSRIINEAVQEPVGIEERSGCARACISAETPDKPRTNLRGGNTRKSPVAELTREPLSYEVHAWPLLFQIIGYYRYSRRVHLSSAGEFAS
jgi:hypothetical protein